MARARAMARASAMAMACPNDPITSFAYSKPLETRTPISTSYDITNEELTKQ